MPPRAARRELICAQTTVGKVEQCRALGTQVILVKSCTGSRGAAHASGARVDWLLGEEMEDKKDMGRESRLLQGRHQKKRLKLRQKERLEW